METVQGPVAGEGEDDCGGELDALGVGSAALGEGRSEGSSDSGGSAGLGPTTVVASADGGSTRSRGTCAEPDSVARTCVTPRSPSRMRAKE